MDKLNINISDNLEGFQEEPVDFTRYETSFLLWIVSELDSGRMTLSEARLRFKFPSHFHTTYRVWQLKYSK